MKIILPILALSMCCSVNSVQVEYFTSAVVECNDNNVNLTESNQDKIVNKYWILPSGDVINNRSVSPMTRGMKQWTVSDNFVNFNLTLHRVDDVDFGYYRCVVVNLDHTIDVVTQGLNVDGPYYGDLEDKYRKNAIIGGIAAGVLFVMVGGFCFVWQCRYSRRKGDADDNMKSAGFDDVRNGKVNEVFEESEKL